MTVAATRGVAHAEPQRMNSDSPIVAALQLTSGLSVDENLHAVRALLAEARAGGACLAVLPENFALMGRSDAARRAIAERDGAGPIQDAIARAARELGLWIIAGTTPLHVDDDPRPANACLVYDAYGARVARYDKIHLFDVDVPGRDESYRESANARPGAEPVVVDTPAGRVGLSVCYDVRFPELYRQLVARGAEVLTVPAAFTVPTGQAHWEVLLRARAVENLSFVIAAAQCGRHPNGRDTYGDSLIADFWGRVLARRAQAPGVVLATLDRAAQRTTRTSFPALQHRRLG
jgi:predicted amidohydrolase